jgi:quinol---cytochrome-c reductase cytochrome c subunit
MPPVVRRALLAAALAALLPAGTAAQTPADLGSRLYAVHCVQCHGPGGEGQPGRAPSLAGVGERSADFYLSTGYMPLERPEQQPTRNDPVFTEEELRALIEFVGLSGGPPVPAPRPDRGNVSEGQRLFTSHCAGCHQIVGEGGYVTGTRVPPLESASAVQIAEAVRIGPYVMPVFDEQQISDAELDSIIAYVEYAKSPDDRGGWSIGHLGPIPEGLVTWLLAGAVLVATCMLIGKRLGRSSPE